MIFKKNILVGLLSFWIFGFVFAYGQPKNIDYSKKSFKELKEIFKTVIDTPTRINIATYCLKRAKTSKKTDELASAYKMFTYIYEEKPILKIQYIDSVLMTKHTFDYDYFPMDLYFDKAMLYYKINNYEKSIENFLKAKEHAQAKNNLIYTLASKQMIGVIKSEYLKDYGSSLKIYLECDKAYHTTKLDHTLSRLYIGNLFNLADVYKSKKMLDSATYYNTLGYKKATLYKDESSKQYFILNEGATLVERKNYKAGIDSINRSLPIIIGYQDYGNTLASYFYLGKAYKGLKKQEKAVLYFTKVDSINNKHHEITPEFIEGYHYLIDYYKKKKNDKMQLYYMNQFIKIDSVFQTDYKIIINKLQKEYDLPLVVQEKDSLINQLNQKTKTDFWLTFGLGALALGLGIYAWGQYRSQQRFKKIIASYRNPLPFSEKVSTPTEPIIPTISLKTTKLSEKIIAELAQKLARFEKNAIFLSKDISQNSLAEQLGTNQKYLSQFINEEKNKSFNQYINDLRITYILEKLTNEKKYRNYSLYALADESGFKSAETFSSAFYKFTNLKPGYFIKQLQKTA